jgi:hypothetical protein
LNSDRDSERGMTQLEDTLRGTTKQKWRQTAIAVKEDHFVRRIQSLPTRSLDRIRIKIKTLEW